jgi:hypothetical protein
VETNAIVSVCIIFIETYFLLIIETFALFTLLYYKCHAAAIKLIKRKRARVSSHPSVVEYQAMPYAITHPPTICKPNRSLS